MRRKLNSHELEILGYWLNMDNDFKNKIYTIKPEFEKRYGRTFEDYEIVFALFNKGMDDLIKKNNRG
jgi:hypothetical protein